MAERRPQPDSRRSLSDRIRRKPGELRFSRSTRHSAYGSAIDLVREPPVASKTCALLPTSGDTAYSIDAIPAKARVPGV